MAELRETPISQADLSPLLGSLGADLGVFYRALQDQINETLAQAEREGWDGERTITAITAILDPEEVSEVEKSLNDTIRTKLIGKLADCEVWAVNGHYIRDNIFIDFTEGGNHERYDWIPEHEIWIDEEIKQEEVTYTIFHEYAESGLMKKGLDYDDAHDCASEMEYAMRHDQELRERFESLIRLQPVLKSAIDLKIQKALVQIRSAIPDEVFKAAKPIGTVSERKDGKYKKTAPGVWERMIEGGEKKDDNKPSDEKSSKEIKGIKIHDINSKQDFDNLNNEILNNLNKSGHNAIGLRMIYSDMEGKVKLPRSADMRQEAEGEGKKLAGTSVVSVNDNYSSQDEDDLIDNYRHALSIVSDYPGQRVAIVSGEPLIGEIANDPGESVYGDATVIGYLDEFNMGEYIKERNKKRQEEQENKKSRKEKINNIYNKIDEKYGKQLGIDTTKEGQYIIHFENKPDLQLKNKKEFDVYYNKKSNEIKEMMSEAGLKE